MTRDELIIELFEKESQRLLELSKDTFADKPKKDCEVEWKDCKKKLHILEQMLEEIPIDYIEDDNETGEMKQVFIGIFEGQPELYFDSKDFDNRYYYVNLRIMNCGNEQFYKDERLLKLSYRVWLDWFVNFRYSEEKEQRIAENLCIYVQAIVIGGEVRNLK